MKARIYHNPRCSKSRQTKTLLEERGVDLEVVEYLSNPPTKKQLDDICKMLGVEPQAIVRTKEKRVSELGLSGKDQRKRSEWLKLMADNPILIERPIVIFGKKAAIGRPPENVLEILQ
jgi:arsenate reductase